MARYISPSCRSCRRIGEKLFLKGTKCYTDKCTLGKKSYCPGQHGKGKSIKSKLSGYGLQLREKQKVKKMYGILEKQFRRYFIIAERSKGVTGKKLLELLERRLDNVVYRACFSLSRAHSRQIVRHGGVLVNSKKVNIPSYLVKAGDIIQIKNKERLTKSTKEIIEKVKDRGVPSWLNAEFDALKVNIVRLPERENMDKDIQEQLIVELYSK